MDLEISDVSAIKENLSKVWIIETHHKVDEGTLAAAGLTDKCDRLIWIDGQTEAPKDKLILPGWVPEPDISELNLSLDRIFVKLLFLTFLSLIDSIDLGRLLDDLEDLGGSKLCLANIGAHGHGHTCMIGSEENGKKCNEDIFWIDCAFLDRHGHSTLIDGFLLASFINDPAASIKKCCKNHVNYELRETVCDSRFQVLRFTSLINWLDIAHKFLYNQLFVSERLNSLEVIDGITNE